MKDPLGVSPSKGNQGTTRGKKRIFYFLDGSRFRRPKTADEEAAWLRETTPQNTRNSTKWSLKIFEEWQGSINFVLNSK